MLSPYLKYLNRLVRYSGPRLAIGVLLYLLFFGPIRNLLDAFYSYWHLPFAYQGQFFFFASIIVVSLLGWISVFVSARLAESLGFRSNEGRGIQISGSGNILHIQQPEDSDLKPKETLVAEIQFSYNAAETLSALQSARNRLESHVVSLRNTSILNLFSGIVIAIIGIYVLSLIFTDLEKYAKETTSNIEPGRFLVFTLVPRLSVALFIQVFAYFFLLMYRSNLADIRYFQNEMTNLDLYTTATIIAMKQKASATEKIALQQLFKMERNRVVGKNQKVINSADDSELMEKLLRSTDFWSRMAGERPTHKSKKE